MLRTGIIIDPRYQNHAPPLGHPERPERMGALLEAIQNYQRSGLVFLKPRLATPQELGWNHDADYVQTVAQTALKPFHAFDPDTSTGPQSYETACLGAGGFLNLLDAVMEGVVDNGFAFVRPPGHHAEFDRAMGFCLFNNVAIGAHYLRKYHHLDRVLILDWDVHHGNGTEHSFYDDPQVLYISLHQWPHYPGSGAAENVGVGAGEGFTVNIPLPTQCGDEEYLAMFQHIIDPICRQFDPQFVLISAGFDAHDRDPLSGMQISDAGFAAMARKLLKLAQDHAQGRCALILEGGYDLLSLTGASMAVLDELDGDNLDQTPPQPKSSLHVFHRVNEVQKRYWGR